MDGALWVLSKVRCEKGLFAQSDKKKRLEGGLEKSRKEPM